MNFQRGQSMVEFSLCASSLVLLLLGTWTIGGYQEVQRRTIVAARQAAYEGAWSAQGFRIEEERSRLASLHFDDAGLADATGAGRLVSTQSVQLQAESGAAPGQATAAFEFLNAPLRASSRFLGSGFDLPNEGFRSGTVIAETHAVANLPLPFRGLQLQLGQPYALLADGWNAAGPAQVVRRAGGLVPAKTWTAVATSLFRRKRNFECCPGSSGRCCLMPQATRAATCDMTGIFGRWHNTTD